MAKNRKSEKAIEEERPAYRYPLTRGWVKQKLCRELAQGEKPQSQLAEEYGVTQGRISQFKKENWDRIQEIRDNFEDEFAGLWAARKVNRLALLEQQIEKLCDRLDTDDLQPSEEVALTRTVAKLVRDIAEELGHIPTKIAHSVDKLNLDVFIEGVDKGKLR